MEQAADELIIDAENEFNPLQEIWLRPRQAIRRIVELDPRLWVLPATVLSGIAGALVGVFDVEQMKPFATAAILAAVLLLGPLAGVFWLYLRGWMLGYAGRLLGGVAGSVEVRAALAWSGLPMTLLIPPVLVVGLLCGFGDPWAASSWPSGLGAAVKFVVTVMMMVAEIWTVILTIATLGEVHRLSLGRTLLSMLLGSMMFAGPALVLLSGLAMLAK